MAARAGAAARAGPPQLRRSPSISDCGSDLDDASGAGRGRPRRVMLPSVCFQEEHWAAGEVSPSTEAVERTPVKVPFALDGDAADDSENDDNADEEGEDEAICDFWSVASQTASLCSAARVTVTAWHDEVHAGTSGLSEFLPRGEQTRAALTAQLGELSRLLLRLRQLALRAQLARQRQARVAPTAQCVALDLQEALRSLARGVDETQAAFEVAVAAFSDLAGGSDPLGRATPHFGAPLSPFRRSVASVQAAAASPFDPNPQFAAPPSSQAGATFAKTKVRLSRRSVSSVGKKLRRRLACM